MTDFGPGHSTTLEVDDVTGAIMTVDYSHHEIHEGSHFFYSGYETLASGGTADIVFTVPAATYAHFLMSIAGTDATTVDVYEGCSGVSGGTAGTAYNNNRNNSGTTTLTILRNPTITAGTAIDGYKFGQTGLGVNPGSGGGASREDEMILKLSTTYMWRIVSGADSNAISWRASWYEKS